MRIIYLLPLCLAACGAAERLGIGGGGSTATADCASPALEQLGRIEAQIAQTEADIARGFAIDTQTVIIDGGVNCPERAERGFCAGDQRQVTEVERDIDIEAAEASLVTLRAQASALRDVAGAEAQACAGRLGG